MAASRSVPGTLPAAVDACLSRHVPRGARLCVGLSGGVDSVALLDLLCSAREARGFAIAAVHVHHGLSPRADDWAAFCAALCERRGVTLAVERVGVARDSRLGLEAAARAARRTAFARQEADFMVLGHHLDDQVETVLLHALRGTGLKGLAAMGEANGTVGTLPILRPLLEASRADIEAHARAAGLEWIEDESNADTGFDRNFLRREVLPLLARRLPRHRDALSRLARHAARAEGLLEELARGDIGPLAPGAPLPLDRLAALGPARQANALREFLAMNALAMPSEARLDEMVRQLLGARRDRQVRIEHDGATLRRFQDHLAVEEGFLAGAAQAVAWRGEPQVDWPAGGGSVAFDRVRGGGIALAHTRESGWTLACRSGGEKMKLEATRPTRTLKNLLQETGVPHWQRCRMPLLLHAGRVVWVPGIGIAAGYRCDAGEEGLEPRWTPPPR
jgi:tRNA(Ile)-lysidine synthase